ncbi:phage/plasmid primase, P4 family [Rhizobium brockwellii]|uniref:Phage/plasmid primase, P4 family n=1 Tax=Rhizobium brockwellii TaxID=3019932 RepID=A0ABU3YEP4_9HYPH|nr:phage/plasmid primase, P4 family [Rhizobium brockwellii]MDV4177307.1 phage/plasmid primase, P4 family [Rhizobium brockwellii]MDV4184306.1 phage/plasmid primase, P4 family [Rhizobium brockwellii]
MSDLLSFFRDYLAPSQIHLVAIVPDSADSSGVSGAFFGTDWQSATEWASKQSANRRNIYYSAPIVTPGLGKKAKKTDIVGVRFAHVDIDPPKDNPAWDKQAALADLIARGAPSVIISTGGGYQALWWLTETTDIPTIEQINRGIADRFSADRCWSSDHLLRVPGLMNYPDKRKQALGRVSVMASLAQPFNGAAYTPAALLVAFPAAPDIVGNAEELPDGPCEGWTGPVDDAELIRLMLSSRGSNDVMFGNKASFRDLWTGDVEALKKFYPSDSDEYGRSDADLALMAHICFFSGRDAKRMERLFGMSALGKREKWTKRPDYRSMTVGRALKGSGSFYNVVRETRTAAPATLPGLPGLPGMTSVSLQADEVGASEDQISQFFVRTHSDTIRYCPQTGEWLRFDGAVWRRDHTVRDDIRKTCADLVERLPEISVAQRNKIRSLPTIRNTQALAEANPQMHVQLTEFDRDPWSLNTPSGVIDLRTGIVRKATPEDRFTQMTAVAPSAEEDCPTWLRFLHTTTGGDSAMISYLKRVVGYSLTGISAEHAVFVLHGHGGNGKGVFMSTIGSLLASYATTAATETFVNTRNSQHLTFIASLKGKRLVSVPEMPDQVTWNLGRIKQISAGDPIQVNSMRADPFEFTPACKLLFACNEPPSLTSAGNDVRRRFNFLPFTTTVTPEQRDKHLVEKLRAEWPGILRWALNGCVEWQSVGLQAPDAVLRATAEYIDSEDVVGQWLEDVSTLDSMAVASNSEIFGSWTFWASSNGHEVGNMRRLGKQLRKRGLMESRSGATRGWKGRSFRPLPPPGDTSRSFAAA